MIFIDFIFIEKKVSKKSSLQGFKPNERNMMNTLHTPAPTTQWRKFFISVWQTFSLFKLQKVRYATKSTIAAILLATPAFLPSTASIFREWRMEWALITVSLYSYIFYFYFLSCKNKHIHNYLLKIIYLFIIYCSLW